MKALIDVKPSPEQLALFSRFKQGIEVIRGAAGSGKTTTALLKLRSSVGFFVSRKKRLKATTPVRVLVLTFNRTLRGYVAELANKQIESGEDIQLDVCTFSSLAIEALNKPTIFDMNQRDELLKKLGVNIMLDDDFIREEVDYVLGRFLPEDLDSYLTTRRDGRGSLPRMERPLREALLTEVIQPYRNHKIANKLLDWNDLAVDLARKKYKEYDVVIVDEAQDFSANQIRAVKMQLSVEHTATFVLDTTQRIYARGFTWQEVGILVRPENSHRLIRNYRNSQEIAKFAAGILTNLEVDDDGSSPDFSKAERTGAVPQVLLGKFSQQLSYSILFISKHIDLSVDSVAFLHAKGGGWFKEIREKLLIAKLPFAEITRKAEWPAGDENIALSTMHSAKGLEFDHVFIIGLDQEVLDGQIDDDDAIANDRRLLAMGVGRARKTVFIGYKSSTKPVLSNFFAAGTFEEHVL